MTHAEFLARLAGCSIQASVLIGLVWLICRMGWVKPRFRSLLWVGVFAHLLVGLAGGVQIAILPEPKPAEFAVLDSAVPPAEKPGAGVETLAAMAWLLGVGAILTLSVWREVRSRRAMGALLTTDVEFSDFVLEAAETVGVKKPRVRIVECEISPCVRGFFSPIVYVPQSLLDEPEESIRAVLIHEFAHIRHGDLRAGYVALAARTLFFFNPLVWVAYREWCVNREAACDEVVLERSQIKFLDYCNLLIRFAERSPALATAIQAASKNFSQLHRRICEMKTTQPKNRGAAPVATIAALLVSALAVIPISVTTRKSSSVEQLHVSKAPRHSSTDAVFVTVDESALGKTFTKNGHKGIALRAEDVQNVLVDGKEIKLGDDIIIVRPEKPEEMTKLDPKLVSDFVVDKDGFLIPKEAASTSDVIKVVDLEKAAPKSVKPSLPQPRERDAKVIVPLAAQPSESSATIHVKTGPSNRTGNPPSTVGPLARSVTVPLEAARSVPAMVPLLPDLPIIPVAPVEAAQPKARRLVEVTPAPSTRPLMLPEIPVAGRLLRSDRSAADADQAPSATTVQAARP